MKVLLGLAAVALTVVGVRKAIRATASPAPEVVTLGNVVDSLGGEVGATELAGGLPASFLIGDAQDVDLLLAARAAAAGMVTTIVDVSRLDGIAREALATRLVEAALDQGGAIAIDASGITASALAGPHAGAVHVSLAAGGVVVGRAPLADVPASLKSIR